MMSVRNEPSSRPFACSRGQSIALIAVYGLMVAMTSLAGLLLPDRAKSDRENRGLQRLPQPPRSFLDVGVFVHQLERYASDQVGFRDQLLQWDRRLRLTLSGDKSGDRYYVGKENWLFARRSDTGILHGDEPLTDQQYAAWIQFLKERADEFASQRMRFAVFFIPAKHEVYPEYLPKGVRVKLDEPVYAPILHALDEYPTLLVHDLRPSLVEAKSWSLLYSPADLHWNGRGAHVGYREIMRELGVVYSGLEEKPEDAFVLTDEFVAGYGSLEKPTAGLARYTGYPEAFPRRWLGVTFKETNAAQGRVSHFAKPSSRLNVVSPHLFECEDANGPRCLFIGDSFRWPLIDMLAEHFERILFVDVRNSFFNRDLLETERPELVIFCAYTNFFNNNPDPYALLGEQSDLGVWDAGEGPT